MFQSPLGIAARVAVAALVAVAAVFAVAALVTAAGLVAGGAVAALLATPWALRLEALVAPVACAPHATSTTAATAPSTPGSLFDDVRKKLIWTC